MYNLGDCLPSKEHEFLLKACLWENQEALDAFEMWKKVSNIKDINYVDQATMRLLPLLYKKLIAQKIEDPLINKFKGAYHKMWYQDNILFHKALPVLRHLHEAGIKVMLLKGVALILDYYKEMGLRPIGDIDIMIEKYQVRKATELMQEMGWFPALNNFVKFVKKDALSKLLSVKKASHFFNNRWSIDLHWYSHAMYYNNETEKELWHYAKWIKFNDIPVLVLSPTDQFLHTCIHGVKGVKGNRVAPIRWLADSYIIINHSQNEIDWERLVKNSKRCGRFLAVKDTLEYLKDVLNAPISDSIIKKFREVKVSEGEVKEHNFACKIKTLTTSTAFWKHAKAVYLFYLSYSKINKNVSRDKKAVNFISYLKYSSCREYWEIPLRLLRKIIILIFKIGKSD